MGRGSGRSPAVPGAAILAAVLGAAVDAPARPVGAAVSDPAAYSCVLEPAFGVPAHEPTVSVPGLRLLFQILQLTVYIH